MIWGNLSLTQRLLALTLAASLPGLIALVTNAVDLRNSRYLEVRAEATRNAQFVVSELDQMFDGLKGAMYAIAQAAEVRGTDSAACSDYVSRVRGELESMTAILVANTDGSIRCFSEPRDSYPNLADRDYFQSAVATKTFTIGTFIASRVSNRKIVPLAMPIVAGSDVQGLVMTGLNLEWLGRHLRERGIARGSTVTIADRNGIIISREPDPDAFVGTPFRDHLRWLLDSKAAGSDEVSGRDGIVRILGYVPASLTPFGFYVSTSVGRDEALAPIDRSNRTSLALFGIGSFAAFVLAWLVGEGIIRRPLKTIVATAQAWRQGDTTVRTGIVDRRDEIGVLGQTFDHLMDENARRAAERETAEAQREILVHELAHRVKNNLAIVQAIASLSFRHSQGPEALQGFQERLQALVRGHDLLTRRNWEKADLAEITEAAIAPAQEDNSHRFTLSGPAIELPPTEAVPIAMILHELCTNALKYGALSNDAGHVAIEWAATDEPDGTRICLTWREDGGPAVEPPQRNGFGSRLIANLTRQMNGHVDVSYSPGGLAYTIDMTVPKAVTPA